MSNETINSYFLGLIQEGFPADLRSRYNIEQRIQLRDEELKNNIGAMFSGLSWVELDLKKIYACFKEDTALAIYCLPRRERAIFFPAVMSYYFIENFDIPGFDYVLENLLLGSDKEGAGGISGELTRQQLAVSLAILSYLSVGQWELPDCKRLHVLRDIILKG